jgi:acyl-CoA dehydrogenase
MLTFATALLLGLGLALLFTARGYWAWVIPGGGVLVVWALGGGALPLLALVAALFCAVAAVLGLRSLRVPLVSARAMPRVARLLPRMSETERIALEAGTVWWDGELFSGAPDWRKLLGFRARPLSEEERAFLEGRDRIRLAEEARDEAIRVDAWDAKAFRGPRA